MSLRDWFTGALLSAVLGAVVLGGSGRLAMRGIALLGGARAPTGWSRRLASAPHAPAP